MEPGGQERCNQSLHLAYSHIHTQWIILRSMRNAVFVCKNVWMDLSVLFKAKTFCTGDGRRSSGNVEHRWEPTQILMHINAKVSTQNLHVKMKHRGGRGVNVSGKFTQPSYVELQKRKRSGVEERSVSC